MRKWLNKVLLAAGRTPPAEVPPVKSIETAEHIATIKARGEALLNDGQFSGALPCFQKAIAFNPLDTGSLISLGFVLIQLGQYAEAEQRLKIATALEPQNHDAFYLLGCASGALGNLDAAVRNFKIALKIKVDFDICRRDLCHMLFQTGKLEEAKRLMIESIALNPEFATFHHYLGNIFFHEKSHEEAINSYQNALSLQPDFAEVHNNLGKIFSEQGNLEAATASFYEAASLKADFEEAFSGFLSTLNYHPDKSAAEIFSFYCEYDTRFVLPLRNTWRHHTNSREPARRLKIGYISPDFHRHSIRHFLEPLLEHHDQASLEIFAYSEQSFEDEVTTRYKTYVDHWIPSFSLTAEAMSERIRSDEIDILVDLAGHTAHNRLDVFARKPAPVSVSWLGYGCTTGVTAIDYYLTDAASAPAGYEDLFSETPWRLQTPGIAYRPAEGMGPVSPLPALERGHVTLGTLTRAVRINHRTIRVWSEILQRVPGARLVVDSRNFEGTSEQECLAARFAEYGIERERLEIGCHSPPWDVLRGMDIGLDCFPHNSGTTLFESLYMGVPFITLAGRPSVGRIGSSLLEGIGHPEWIARTEDEYVELTVALASNLTRLAEIRNKLRSEMEASPLMDEAGFARKVEAAYREMFSQWCQNNP